MLLVVLLPFVTTYSAGVFWVRSASDYEKPRVAYTNQLYAEFLFASKDDLKKTESYQYSTVRQINDVLPNPLAPPSIEVVRYDFDRDTHVDQYNLTLKVKLPERNLVLR